MQIKVGTDIVEVERIRLSIENYNDKFLNRVYTEQEINYCNKGKDSKYQHFAARFAAKEAVYKAISEMIEGPLIWKNIEVKNNKAGRPEIILHGPEKENVDSIDVSLSHVKDTAIATVVVVINK